VYRYLIKFAEEKSVFSGLYESTYFKKIIIYAPLVACYKKCDTQELQYCLLTRLIELGKFYLPAGIMKYNITVFIEAGISNIYNEEPYFNYHDNIYINNIRKEIHSLIDNGVCDKNFIIFRDATASGLQNYGILLGYIIEALDAINLDSDT